MGLQAQMIEPIIQKMFRESAARALTSCLAVDDTEKQARDASLKQRIQGFGNYQPPLQDADDQHLGARGLVDQAAGVVGDAIADTVDDVREKGAVGAVRDGIADAADLIVDGVGTIFDLIGARKKS